MTILVASQTLDKINGALELDQGARFRGLLRESIKLVDDAYSTKEQSFRSHLGASLIGRECGRELWLSFRWATPSQNEGRIVRLFNRGHLEEARFVALLQMIGVEVWQFDENGKQFRIYGHNGHFGGSMDGVVLGVPEMPNTPMICEFKTHGDKSFTKVKDDGVKEAKFEHYVQMQVYMGKNELTHALYLAVNKNDDAIYVEIVSFDKDVYEMYLERSIMIIDAVEPPIRINESPGWYKCRFCSQANVCQSGIAPARNCRTCRWSTPIQDGAWICELTSPPRLITEIKQLQGCERYDEHPSIRARM
jgi:hypothetical protein